MNVSFYLSRPKAKTETSIYARICYNGNKIKWFPNEKINPKFWNKDSQRAKQTDKFKEYPEFNQRLIDWESKIKSLYRKWINDNQGVIPNQATMKLLLEKELGQVEPDNHFNNFFDFFNYLINQSKSGARLQPKSGKPYSKATIQVYSNTLNRIKAFRDKFKRNIDFNSIDLGFYIDFVGYLTNDLKLASNTIGKDIKTIKVVMGEATERGLNLNLQFKSKKFSVTSEKTDAIYLTASELKEIELLDLCDNNRLNNVRDLFLVACYTGLRYSDFSVLKSEQFKNGFIQITQVKTGEPIVIPIHSTVARIVEKYNGKLPCSISNQKTNEYLKELGKLLPFLSVTTSKTFTKGGVRVIENKKKWEVLTSHTARRSFATNEYLAGTPAITIMAITGHRTEKAFLRYIKLTPNEHAILLKAHWLKRNELIAV